MKHISFILLLLAVHFSLSAQDVIRISHYAFPEFLPGVVLMKSGAENKTKLNFNSVTGEIVFEQNGQYLALADEIIPQIDTVFIEDRKFVRMDNKFMEILSQGDYGLFLERKCIISPPAKQGAYGMKTQTASIDSYSSIMTNGGVYKLKLPDDYKVEPYAIYWLVKGDKRTGLRNERQLRRYFNDKKELYKKYTSENKVVFNDENSIAELVLYMETTE